MEMSEIQAARLLLGGDGRAGQAASRQVGQESASVRYGEVKSVDAEAGTVTVLLDGQAREITLTDATASTRLKASDRVKIVKQGQSWVIDLAGGISRALDTAASEANARMDAHDKKMAEQQKEIKAAQDELAGMDGKIDSAVKDAVSKLETPDGGNHIIVPGSATESFSANVPYSPHKTSYAVVYYRCTYTDTYGSVKFPITEGGSANVVLKELTAFEAADGSIALGCAENITVALGNYPNKTFTITRSNPYRFAIKPSGNNINANPGPQFEITQVTLCGQ